MTLEVWAWLALAAYTLHIMEEFALDWRDWARSVIGLPVEWTDFYITNAAVIVLGIVQAQLANVLPVVALVFAALMLINATFFHVLPVIVTKGRFSPGAITAVLLFYPVGIGMYRTAAAEGLLTRGVLLGSMLGGAVLMAYPIILLRLKGLPYFRQAP
ncbi:MAG TPA: HXXEE domain-containing protein [Ancylobacter sp.]